MTTIITCLILWYLFGIAGSIIISYSEYSRGANVTLGDFFFAIPASVAGFVLFFISLCVLASKVTIIKGRK